MLKLKTSWYAAEALGVKRRAPVAPPVKLEVSVFSDVACPWCFLGKRRLDRAINLYMAKYPGSIVDVQWHPFIIDPSVAPQGENYQSYNERRWGGDAWTATLRRSAEPEGINFADWQWWPNTVQAHELIALAAERGKASQAFELLFRRTYEQGGNVSSMHELEAIGASLGLPNVGAHLRAGTYRSLVLDEDRTAKKELNISAVPYVVIGCPGSNSYALAGAQRSERLMSVFELVVGKAQGAAATAAAAARLQQQQQQGAVVGVGGGPLMRTASPSAAA